jgi:hypothetical protein
MVAFPNFKEALLNNVAITTKVRSCTIMPHYVGYVFELFNNVMIDLLTYGRTVLQDPIYGTQRQKSPTCGRHAGYGGT